jgi:hypothetical protein
MIGVELKQVSAEINQNENLCQVQRATWCMSSQQLQTTQLTHLSSMVADSPTWSDAGIWKVLIHQNIPILDFSQKMWTSIDLLSYGLGLGSLLAWKSAIYIIMDNQLQDFWLCFKIDSEAVTKTRPTWLDTRLDLSTIILALN